MKDVKIKNKIKNYKGLNISLHSRVIFWGLIDMKKITLFGVLVLVLILAGCGQKIVCNKPYILVGSECCLDKDDNGICDKDEIKEESKVIEEPPKQEETKEIQETAPVEVYSVYDLQNDLNDIYGGVYTFSKTETESINYYESVLGSNLREVVDENNPNLVYNVNVDYRNMIIEELKDKKIETSEEFKNYVGEQFRIYKEAVEDKRKSFEDEYKNLAREVYIKSPISYVYYQFKDLSKEAILPLDEFSVIEEGIIENLYVSLDNYIFNYIMAYKEDKLESSTLTSEKKDQFFDLRYSVSILCKPNLIVHLNEKEVEKQNAGEDYEKGEVENQVGIIKTKLISEAEKVAEACS